MIEETGVVKSVEGPTAKVMVQKRGACEKCAAAGVCDPSDEGMEVEALNPVHARVGQNVKVSIRAQAYLKGSLFVYGIPLAAFIGGIVIGKKFGESFLPGVNSDTVSFITGFVLFAVSFLIARSWSKKAESQEEYKPVIDEILD